MNEEQLQELLSVYRYKQPMPALASRSTSARWWLAAAAVIAMIIGIAAWPRHRGGWHIATGFVSHELRPGEAIATGASGVRLESRAVGVVEVAADSRLRFEGGNRLSLDRGRIHAKTISPPGVFVVDTPRARAIDLGCEYTLAIAEGGGGQLRVSAGWVVLERDWKQSLVPQGAKAVIAADGHIGPPVFEDASPAFQKAVADGDLNTTLALARRRDGLTVINLFRDATTEERLRIYDRLNALVPAPPTVPRDAMLSWNLATLNDWWPLVLNASGVRPAKKTRGTLRGL